MSEVVTLGECMAVLYPPEPVTLDDTPSLLLDIGGAQDNLSTAQCRLVQWAGVIRPGGGAPLESMLRDWHARLAARGRAMLPGAPALDADPHCLAPRPPKAAGLRQAEPDRPPSRHGAGGGAPGATSTCG